jgi:16S rRNA (adenine1518-N6/adenine1519-N6)-dimethyltransferase
MADALRVDEGALVARFAPNLTPKIVANLPYNIATPLLIRWLTGPFSPERMALMFQKEVALRIVAAPGSRDYGRLSVICQAMARPRLALSLPARAFSPPPRVESAVAVLEPLADRPSGETLSALEQVTAAAFGQRRKMLRSSLRGLGGEALCAAADLSSDRRAEEIDVAGFVRLAQALLREPGSERTLS